MRLFMVTGKGHKDTLLSDVEVFDICQQAFANQEFEGKKILAIIPDHTRSGPIDVMFRTVYNLLADRVSLLDFIIAAGTHPPMSDEAINHRVGITQEERTSTYPKARFFNHHWKDPDQIQSIGTITKSEVSRISNGLMEEDVNVTINKMVFDYDI